MGQIVSVFPNLPAYRQTVTLGDVQFGLRLTWRQRLAAWYADVYAADGTSILLGQRVSPRWSIGHGLNAEGAPAGVLFIRGPDEYERGDLGNTLQIVFYSTDELPVAPEDDSGLSVTVP